MEKWWGEVREFQQIREKYVLVMDARLPPVQGRPSARSFFLFCRKRMI